MTEDEPTENTAIREVSSIQIEFFVPHESLFNVTEV